MSLICPLSPLLPCISCHYVVSTIHSGLWLTHLPHVCFKPFSDFLCHLLCLHLFSFHFSHRSSVLFLLYIIFFPIPFIILDIFACFSFPFTSSLCSFLTHLHSLCCSFILLTTLCLIPSLLYSTSITSFSRVSSSSSP